MATKPATSTSLRKLFEDAAQPTPERPEEFSRQHDIKGGTLMRVVEEAIEMNRQALPRGGALQAAIHGEIAALEQLQRDLVEAATAASAEDFWVGYQERRKT